MPLATIADIKAALKSSSTDQDAILAVLLGTATGMAEQLIGMSPGTIMRRTNIVEYPTGEVLQSRYVSLRARPIESISEVRQVYSAGKAADFAEADALERITDFDFEPVFGTLERFNKVWYLAPRCLRVTYTAGYLDPLAVVAAWDIGEDYDVGDLVSHDGKVYCAQSDNASSTENQPGIAASEELWALVHQVPADLRYGVTQQAIALYQSKSLGGFTQVSLPNGGSYQAKDKPCPHLESACKGFRRLM